MEGLEIGWRGLKLGRGVVIAWRELRLGGGA